MGLLSVDPLVFGRRLRHYRKARGLTLKQLGSRVGKQAPYLSMVESGKRRPRAQMIELLAQALDVNATDLLRPELPDRRSRLEVGLERAQQEPLYGQFRLPHIKPTTAVSDEMLEHLLTLYEELKRVHMPATPAVADARAANIALRREMRQHDFYLAPIEKLAGEALTAVEYSGTGALPQRVLNDLTGHFGFTVQQIQGVPASTRSVTDLRRRRILIPQRDALRTRSARAVILQTLAHFALDHPEPSSFFEHLRQRIECNYFAAAVLVPQGSAVSFLRSARSEGDLSVGDLKELFYVTYETAAHRFINLATRFLGIRTHFVRSDAEGLIWKAMENDGVPFPTAIDGGIEGQRLCRQWGTRQVFHSDDKFAVHYQYTDTPKGTFWCATHVEADGDSHHAITVGTAEEDAEAFRGSDTPRHAVSRCPDGRCCGRPSAAAAARWQGRVWAAPSAHSHVPAAMPTGAFPGVDVTEVYDFLDQNTQTS
jgi:transcriptional regulator with XRE-family HTH domain